MPDFFSSSSQGGSSTKRLVKNNESIPTGMLMKKIQCQLKLSVIQPPSVGPMAGATTTAMPYMAKACPRFSMGNESARIACSDGCNPPPPAPCRTRAKIKIGKLGAIPHKKELAVKSKTQSM